MFRRLGVVLKDVVLYVWYGGSLYASCLCIGLTNELSAKDAKSLANYFGEVAKHNATIR